MCKVYKGGFMINSPEELFKYMKNNIKFGFYSSYDKGIHIRNKEDKIYNKRRDYEYLKLIFSSYSLQSPDMLDINMCGACFDQVEYSKRWFLKHGYKIYTYYINCHNHAFLIYKEGNKYCLFDTTIDKIDRIIKRDSLNSIKKYDKELQKYMGNYERFIIFRYYDLKYGSDLLEIIYQITKDRKYVNQVKLDIKKELEYKYKLLDI